MHFNSFYLLFISLISLASILAAPVYGNCKQDVVKKCKTEYQLHVDYQGYDIPFECRRNKYYILYMSKNEKPKKGNVCFEYLSNHKNYALHWKNGPVAKNKCETVLAKIKFFDSNKSINEELKHLRNNGQVAISGEPYQDKCL